MILKRKSLLAVRPNQSDVPDQFATCIEGIKVGCRRIVFVTFQTIRVVAGRKKLLLQTIHLVPERKRCRQTAIGLASSTKLLMRMAAKQLLRGPDMVGFRHGESEAGGPEGVKFSKKTAEHTTVLKSRLLAIRHRLGPCSGEKLRRAPAEPPQTAPAIRAREPHFL